MENNIVYGKFSPTERAETIEEYFNAVDRETLGRHRPYHGQSHTFTGERGKQLVFGENTMRDIYDVILLAIANAAQCDIPSYKLTMGDIGELDLANIDPVAVAQNVCCHIEKLMGIYPNVPPIG